MKFQPIRRFLSNNKLFLNLFISLQLIFTSLLPYTANAINFNTGKKIIEDWFSTNANSIRELKGATLKSIKTKSTDGKEIEGLMISGGELDGRIFQSEDGLLKLSEWTNLKKQLLNNKNLRTQAIKDGLTAKTLTLGHFSAETFAFFVAIGAIQFTKSIFSPELNPMAVSQHAESIKHPLSHLSFAAFMYANGVVAPILEAKMSKTNPISKLNGYLGMAAGLMASNIVHEVSALLGGQLDKCVADLEKADQDAKIYDQYINTIIPNCDQAFNSWSAYGLDRMQTFFPELAGLVLSTILASGLETYVVKKSIVKLGLGFLLEVIPTPEKSLKFGYYGLKFGQWVVTRVVGNVLPFTVADELIGRPLHHQLSKLDLNFKINSAEYEISDHLKTAIQNNWNEESQKIILKDLIKVKMLFKQWNKLSNEELLNAYLTWLAKVSELSASYELTHYVYAEFFKRANPKSNRPSSIALMRREDPLHGINQLQVENDQDRNDFEDPTSADSRKLRNIVFTSLSALKEIEKMAKTQTVLKIKNISEKLYELATNAIKHDQADEIEIQYSYLNQIGNIFSSLNRELGYVDMHPGLHGGTRVQNNNLNNDDTQLLNSFRNSFGNPFPLFQKGARFFTGIESQSNVILNSKVLSANSNYIKYTKNINGIYGLTPVQSIFLNMFFGVNIFNPKSVFKTEKNSIFSNLAQMPPQFNSPRLTKSFINIEPVPNSDLRTKNVYEYNTVLNTKVKYNGKIYDNIYILALEQWEQIFTDSNIDAFEINWNKHVKQEYIAAWIGLESQYKKFLKEFYDQIKNTNKSMNNKTSLYEGGLKQKKLELKFHLSVLESLYKTFYSENNSELLTKDNKHIKPFFLLERNLIINKGPSEFTEDFLSSSNETVAPLFRSLDQNVNLSLYNHTNQVLSDLANSYFQNAILNQFAELESQIENIKFKKVNNPSQDGSYYILNVLKNHDYDKMKSGFSKIISQLGEINNKIIEKNPKNYTLKYLLDVNVNSINNLYAEISNYLHMLNELNYIGSDGSPGSNSKNDGTNCKTTINSSSWTNRTKHQNSSQFCD